MGNIGAGKHMRKQQSHDHSQRCDAISACEKGRFGHEYLQSSNQYLREVECLNRVFRTHDHLQRRDQCLQGDQRLRERQSHGALIFWQRMRKGKGKNAFDAFQQCFVSSANTRIFTAAISACEERQIRCVARRMQMSTRSRSVQQSVRARNGLFGLRSATCPACYMAVWASRLQNWRGRQSRSWGRTSVPSMQRGRRAAQGREEYDLHTM
jgi:hypothetical protein